MQAASKPSVHAGPRAPKVQTIVDGQVNQISNASGQGASGTATVLSSIITAIGADLKPQQQQVSAPVYTPPPAPVTSNTTLYVIIGVIAVVIIGFVIWRMSKK